VPNDWVNFKIKHVRVPEPAEILMKLHGDDLLQGRIIQVSDSGFEQEAFAAIEVEGLRQLVVVSKKNIRGVVRE
jgi:hypothetical protein